MTIMDFNSIYKTVCHNRAHVTTGAVAPGSYLAVTDFRNNASAIKQHTYEGVFYGITYVDISNAGTQEFMLFYACESLASGVKTIGMRVRPTGGNNMLLELTEGTFDPTGTPHPLTLFSSNYPIPIPAGYCQIAWYFNGNVGLGNTSAFWMNRVEISSLNSYPVGPATSTYFPSSVIMSAETPNDYKLGMLWAGFEKTINKAKFQEILMNWTGPNPYFLGRRGEYPLSGLPSKSYINCSESIIKDLAIEGYYSPAGTVNVIQSSEIVTVETIPDYYGFDE